MTNQKNKNIEKVHFAYFKETCKELPPGIVDDKGECPDFVIAHSKGKLGVEHTRLFKITDHPNAPQVLERFRMEIVNYAKELCEKDIPPLFVQVWFTLNQRVPKERKSEIKRIGNELVNYIKKWHEENPSKNYEALKPHLEISEFFQIFITRANYHYWVVEACAIEHNCSIKKLQDCINEKNNRYEKYFKKCDECWLLIVVDIFKNSQSLVPNLTHRYDSKFARVFCLDASHRKNLQELYIKRIPPGHQ